MAVVVIGVCGDVPFTPPVGELVDHLVDEHLEKLQGRELEVGEP